jgi:hypothetical protein
MVGTRARNPLQGEFGEAWLGAVAAGCGLLHGRPTSLDVQKADVQLVQPGDPSGTRDATVNVQVKTTGHLRRSGSGHYGYDLDLET